MSTKHTHSGRWQYGLALSLVTAIFWGMLPIFLIGLFPVMDPLTITFYRFFIASFILFFWLLSRNKLKQLEALKDKHLLSRVMLAGLMLALNYGGYVVALEMMSPAGAQVIIQLAPILLMLSGVFIFHEVFTSAQWAGVATFIIGLIVFFWNRILEIGSGTDQYWLGMIIMIFAAIFWAAYASLQKQLLTRFSSVQLIFLINALGAIFFFFVSEPTLVFTLNSAELLLLLLCGINTLVAYGSFSEALEHWEASKISAMFTITPVLTIIFVEITNLFFAIQIESDPITPTLIIGAFLVVAGAAYTSLGQKKTRKENT